MQYREFGNTGIKISALGFGAIRLPCYEKDGEWYADDEKSAEVIIHRAIELRESEIKCPQKINIREQLKEVIKELS